MVRAYELLAEAGDWPLHLGVTEAGPAFQGTIKSATAFGALLCRASATPSGSRCPPRRSRRSRSASRSCSRSTSAAPPRDRLLPLVRPRPGRRLQARRGGHRRPRGHEVPLRVAVMGCVVNGPGEAREADLGVASGNGKGQIFVKGEVIKTVPESQIVETLIEEAMRIAEGMEAVDGGRAATVSVSRRSARRSGRPRRRRLAPACSRTRHGVRVRSGTPDLDAFLALTGRDPVVNVFADHRARTTNSSRAGWAARCGAGSTGGDLVAALPRRRQPGAGRGDDGRRAGLRGAGAGPQPQRLDDRRPARRGRGLLEHGRGPVGRPRELRWQQPHLQIDHAPLVEARPRRTPDHPRRPRPALPGLRGDVHRGGRRLARGSAAVPSSTGRGCSS